MDLITYRVMPFLVNGYRIAEGVNSRCEILVFTSKQTVIVSTNMFEKIKASKTGMEKVIQAEIIRHEKGLQP